MAHNTNSALSSSPPNSHIKNNTTYNNETSSDMEAADVASTPSPPPQQPNASTPTSSPSSRRVTLKQNQAHRQRNRTHRPSRHSRIISSFTAPLLSPRRSTGTVASTSSSLHRYSSLTLSSLQSPVPPPPEWSFFVPLYMFVAFLIGVIVFVVFFAVPFASNTTFQVSITSVPSASVSPHPIDGEHNNGSVSTTTAANITVTSSSAMNPVLHQIHVWNTRTETSCSLRRSVCVIVDDQFRVLEVIDLTNSTSSRSWSSPMDRHELQSVYRDDDGHNRQERFVDVNSMPIYPRYALYLHEVATLPSGTWRWVCDHYPCQPVPYHNNTDNNHGDISEDNNNNNNNDNKLSYDIGQLHLKIPDIANNNNNNTESTIPCYRAGDHLFLSSSILPDALLSLVLAATGASVAVGGVMAWMCFLGRRCVPFMRIWHVVSKRMGISTDGDGGGDGDGDGSNNENNTRNNDYATNYYTDQQIDIGPRDTDGYKERKDGKGWGQGKESQPLLDDDNDNTVETMKT